MVGNINEFWQIDERYVQRWGLDNLIPKAENNKVTDSKSEYLAYCKWRYMYLPEDVKLAFLLVHDQFKVGEDDILDVVYQNAGVGSSSKIPLEEIAKLLDETDLIAGRVAEDRLSLLLPYFLQSAGAQLTSNMTLRDLTPLIDRFSPVLKPGTIEEFKALELKGSFDRLGYFIDYGGIHNLIESIHMLQENGGIKPEMLQLLRYAAVDGTMQSLSGYMPNREVLDAVGWKDHIDEIYRWAVIRIIQLNMYDIPHYIQNIDAMSPIPPDIASLLAKLLPQKSMFYTIYLEDIMPLLDQRSAGSSKEGERSSLIQIIKEGLTINVFYGGPLVPYVDEYSQSLVKTRYQKGEPWLGARALLSLINVYEECFGKLDINNLPNLDIVMARALAEEEIDIYYNLAVARAGSKDQLDTTVFSKHARRIQDRRTRVLEPCESERTSSRRYENGPSVQELYVKLASIGEQLLLLEELFVGKLDYNLESELRNVAGMLLSHQFGGASDKALMQYFCRMASAYEKIYHNSPGKLLSDSLNILDLEERIQSDAGRVMANRNLDYDEREEIFELLERGYIVLTGNPIDRKQLKASGRGHRRRHESHDEERQTIPQVTIYLGTKKKSAEQGYIHEGIESEAQNAFDILVRQGFTRLEFVFEELTVGNTTKGLYGVRMPCDQCLGILDSKILNNSIEAVHIFGTKTYPWNRNGFAAINYNDGLLVYASNGIRTFDVNLINKLSGDMVVYISQLKK